MIIDSPIVSGSHLASGSYDQYGNVTITGSLNVTGSIIGNLTGTSSYATTSSYALTASVALNVPETASYALNALSASYALTASHAAHATTASYAVNAVSASYVPSTSFSERTTQIDVYVKNMTGAQINKGTVVRIVGSVGDNPLIATASYTDDNNSANTLGITTTNIANDSFGYVISEGILIGIDTSTPGWSAGQLLYLGANGTITGSAPVAPLHAVRLGEVLRVQLNNGSMYVRIDNGFELGELHDVKDTTTTGSYGDLLVKSGSIWINSKQLTGSYGVTGSLTVVGGITATNTITAQTLVVQTITSSVVYSSGSNVFGNDLANTQILTGSVTITGSLAVNNSNVILTNQTSSMSVLSASYASTASFVTLAQTASYVQNAQTASFVQNAQSASYVLNAVSSSFALTSSYSLSGTGFPFSGSAVITGSLLVTNLSGSGVRYVVTDANGLMTAQTASAVIKTTQAFTATAGQTTFAVTNGYSTGYVDVFINGSKLNSTEFTDTSGTDVVLATGSFANDIVEVVKYLPASGVSNNVLRQLTTFTATAGQTVFNVDYTPGLLDIFYNGSHLNTSEYTANNGTSFTLVTASAANDILDVFVYSYQVGAFSGIGGQGIANQVAFYSTTSSISGSNNFTFDGSTLRLTGSFIQSGSSTFTNIGPTILSGSVNISGSLTVTEGITISGSIASASYAANAELLDGLDSTSFVYTSSFNTYSSSMSTRVTNLENTASVLTTASASFAVVSSSFATTSASLSTRVTAIEGKYATTGSNVFVGTQTITGSLLQSGSLSVNGCIVSTGQIVAQTINVQQVTSSIVYSCGSNIFGCSTADVQQMTGSVRITGSLNVIGNACMTSVCSPAFVGGTVSGTTATFSGQISQTLGDNQILYTNTSVTTGYQYMRMVSTGAQLTWGIDANPSAGLLTNSLANSAVIGNSKNAPFHIGTNAIVRFTMDCNGVSCFNCELTAKSLGTNDLILNNLNYECANYVDGTRGSWLIQEGACDLFIINQVSGKKYKFNLIEIK